MIIVQKDAIGVIFTITILKPNGDVLNLASATTKNFIFRKSDGTIITRTGSFVTDGTDGKLRYTTIAGDLSLSGPWEIQADVAGASGYTGRSEVAPFSVSDNLV